MGRILYRAMETDERKRPKVGRGRSQLGILPATEKKAAESGMSVYVDGYDEMFESILPESHGGINPFSTMFCIDEEAIQAKALRVKRKGRAQHADIRAAVVPQGEAMCIDQCLSDRLATTKPDWTEDAA